jgi:hypothetical protein
MNVCERERAREIESVCKRVYAVFTFAVFAYTHLIKALLGGAVQALHKRMRERERD